MNFVTGFLKGTCKGKQLIQRCLLIARKTSLSDLIIYYGDKGLVVPMGVQREGTAERCCW